MKSLSKIAKNAIDENRATKRRLEGTFQKLRAENEGRIDKLTLNKEEIDVELSNLVINTSNSPSLNQEVIDKIRSEAETKIQPLLSEIEQNRKNIANKIEAQSGVAKSRNEALTAEIDQIKVRIDEIKSISDQRIAQRKEQYSTNGKKLISKKQSCLVHK